MNRFFSRSGNWIGVFIAIAATGSIGYNIIQQEQIERIKTINELVKQKESIMSDSLNDVIMSRMSELRDNISEVARNTGRVEGMVAASMNIPPEQNQTSAIWHEGYYRGMGQLAIVEESAYISGYHRATEDMGCPASARENAAFKYQQDKQIDMESQQFNKALDEAEQRRKNIELIKNPKLEPKAPEAPKEAPKTTEKK